MSSPLHINVIENMLTGTNPGNTTARTLYLNREADRLKTFESWTNLDVDKAKLAKYGFYYKGPEDAVECAYCKVAIAGWDIGDDPLREHIHWSESCPFLLRNAPVNVPNEENFETQLPSRDYFTPIFYNEDNPISDGYRPTQKIVLCGNDAARHPAYASLDARLESFKIWPKSLKQTPRDLSEAGLFYLGKSDHVKCFSCGGALRDWNDDDKPWIEHAKYFQHCEYLKQRRGQEFIENITASNDDDSSMDDATDEESEIKDDVTSESKCNICLMNDLDTIFLPCMHVYTCVRCGFGFTHCPVCRSKISEMKKCYFVHFPIREINQPTRPPFKRKLSHNTVKTNT